MIEVVFAAVVIGLWLIFAAAVRHLWRVLTRDDINDV